MAASAAGATAAFAASPASDAASASSFAAGKYCISLSDWHKKEYKENSLQHFAAPALAAAVKPPPPPLPPPTSRSIMAPTVRSSWRMRTSNSTVSLGSSSTTNSPPIRHSLSANQVSHTHKRFTWETNPLFRFSTFCFSSSSGHRSVPAGFTAPVCVSTTVYNSSSPFGRGKNPSDLPPAPKPALLPSDSNAASIGPSSSPVDNAAKQTSPSEYAASTTVATTILASGTEKQQAHATASHLSGTAGPQATEAGRVAAAATAPAAANSVLSAANTVANETAAEDQLITAAGGQRRAEKKELSPQAKGCSTLCNTNTLASWCDSSSTLSNTSASPESWKTSSASHIAAVFHNSSSSSSLAAECGRSAGGDKESRDSSSRSTTEEEKTRGGTGEAARDAVVLPAGRSMTPQTAVTLRALEESMRATEGRVAAGAAAAAQQQQEFQDLVLYALTEGAAERVESTLAAAVRILDCCSNSEGNAKLLVALVEEKLRYSSDGYLLLAAVDLVAMLVSNLGVEFASALDSSFIKAFTGILKMTTLKRSLSRDVKKKLNKLLTGPSAHPGVATDPLLHRLKRKILYLLQLWHDSFVLQQERLPALFDAYRRLRSKGVCFPTVDPNMKFMVKNAEDSPAFDVALRQPRRSVSAGGHRLQPPPSSLSSSFSSRVPASPPFSAADEAAMRKAVALLLLHKNSSSSAALPRGAEQAAAVNTLQALQPRLQMLLEKMAAADDAALDTYMPRLASLLSLSDDVAVALQAAAAAPAASSAAATVTAAVPAAAAGIPPVTAAARRSGVQQQAIRGQRSSRSELTLLDSSSDADFAAAAVPSASALPQQQKQQHRFTPDNIIPPPPPPRKTGVPALSRSSSHSKQMPAAADLLLDLQDAAPADLPAAAGVAAASCSDSVPVVTTFATPSKQPSLDSLDASFFLCNSSSRASLPAACAPYPLSPSYPIAAAAPAAAAGVTAGAVGPAAAAVPLVGASSVSPAAAPSVAQDVSAGGGAVGAAGCTYTTTAGWGQKSTAADACESRSPVWPANFSTRQQQQAQQQQLTQQQQFTQQQRLEEQHEELVGQQQQQQNAAMMWGGVDIAPVQQKHAFQADEKKGPCPAAAAVFPPALQGTAAAAALKEKSSTAAAPPTSSFPSAVDLVTGGAAAEMHAAGRTAAAAAAREGALNSTSSRNSSSRRNSSNGRRKSSNSVSMPTDSSTPARLWFPQHDVAAYSTSSKSCCMPSAVDRYGAFDDLIDKTTSSSMSAGAPRNNREELRFRAAAAAASCVAYATDSTLPEAPARAKISCCCHGAESNLAAAATTAAAATPAAATPAAAAGEVVFASLQQAVNRSRYVAAAAAAGVSGSSNDTIASSSRAGGEDFGAVGSRLCSATSPAAGAAAAASASGIARAESAAAPAEIGETLADDDVEWGDFAAATAEGAGGGDGDACRREDASCAHTTNNLWSGPAAAAEPFAVAAVSSNACRRREEDKYCHETAAAAASSPAKGLQQQASPAEQQQQQEGTEFETGCSMKEEVGARAAAGDMQLQHDDEVEGRNREETRQIVVQQQEGAAGETFSCLQLRQGQQQQQAGAAEVTRAAYEAGIAAAADASPSDLLEAIQQQINETTQNFQYLDF